MEDMARRSAAPGITTSGSGGSYYRQQWEERRRNEDDAAYENLANWPILKKSDSDESPSYS